MMPGACDSIAHGPPGLSVGKSAALVYSQLGWMASAGQDDPKTTKKTNAAKNAPKAKKVAQPQDGAGPRAGSKTARVVAMLQRKNGATLAEIMDKMGWQKHTVHGFMAGAMRLSRTPSPPCPERTWAKRGATVASPLDSLDQRPVLSG